MFIIDLANMFTNELEKCKTIMWSTCSQVKLTGEYVGLVPGIQHLISNIKINRMPNLTIIIVCTWIDCLDNKLKISNNFYSFAITIYRRKSGVGKFLKNIIFEYKFPVLFALLGI